MTTQQFFSGVIFAGGSPSILLVTVGTGIYCKGAENFEEKSPRYKKLKRRATSEVKHPSAILIRVKNFVVVHCECRPQVRHPRRAL